MKKGGFIVEIGGNVEKVSYYSPKLKKWFEEKNIAFELNSSECDLWYPERKIVYGMSHQGAAY